MDFLELSKSRYSVLHYQNKPVPDELLKKIIEAGISAPTACNFQPQKIKLINSDADRDKLNRYVISEKEHLALLPEGALRILVTADLEVIKARFTQRMRGNLPVPVAAMLEKKHGCFDGESHDLHVVSGETDSDSIVDRIRAGV